VLVTQKPTLFFVSTRFLFPVDSGGKIRTTQVLRGLKGGAFRVVLASPATRQDKSVFATEIDSVCDEFISWPQPARGPLFKLTRMRHLLGALPIPVRTDRHDQGIALVKRYLDEEPAVAVFDFAHAGVLMPENLSCASVMFTHNVEAEIFRRHKDVASNPVFRLIWANQYRKMHEFEKRTLQRFDVVVAVAERDSQQFSRDYGIGDSFVIPTGVDLDFFEYAKPERGHDIVFCGSMDWMANQEGVSYFMDNVWDRVIERVPDARMTVVGRAPPDKLVEAAARRKLNWTFTGFVDDVRPFIQGAAVNVIPLRVGGGTRLKVYEAMAMGSPVVATSIGVEGLPVEAGVHYLKADDAPSFADAVVALIENDQQRETLSREGRNFVEENFCYTVAARAFEDSCKLAIKRRTKVIS